MMNVNMVVDIFYAMVNLAMMMMMGAQQRIEARMIMVARRKILSQDDVRIY